MRALAFVSVSFLVACGATTGSAPESTPSNERSSNGSASSEPAPTPPPPRYAYAEGDPCPAAFATATPDCGTGPPGCVRADGTECYCASPTWCGGAAMEAMLPPVWQCGPVSTCGPIGTPCSGTTFCPSGACSWMGGVRCENDVWTSVPPGPAPP